MNTKKYKVLAVGSGDPGRPPIAVGYVKTYIENAPSLAGKATVTIIYPSVERSYRGMEEAIISASPDMVTFTPHEDWDLPTMIELCRNLKKWNRQLPIIICAENPRNRLEVDTAAESEAIDYVIHGEPELPLEAIIRHYAIGDSLPKNHPGIICFTKTQKAPATTRR